MLLCLNESIIFKFNLHVFVQCIFIFTAFLFLFFNIMLQARKTKMSCPYRDILKSYGSFSKTLQYCDLESSIIGITQCQNPSRIFRVQSGKMLSS